MKNSPPSASSFPGSGSGSTYFCQMVETGTSSIMATKRELPVLSLPNPIWLISAETLAFAQNVRAS